jgi:hypothetical protein
MNMRIHKISIKGNDIADDRIRKLSNTRYEKKKPTGVEKIKYLKTAGMYLFVFFVMAAIVFISLTRRRIRITFAVIAVVVAVVCLFSLIKELTKLFRDIRQKSQRGAVRSFLEIVLLGDDNDKFMYKSPVYAYNSLCRMLPDMLCPGEREFVEYLDGFREMMKQKIYGDYDDLFLEEFPVKKPAPCVIKIIEVTETKKISENASVINAVFGLEYSAISKAEAKKRGTAAKSQVYACFTVTFDIVMIQSNGFWFIADPMPEYTIPSDSAEGVKVLL